MNNDDPRNQDDAPLRDLLDALRAEWQEQPGGEELPPESLEDCDGKTQQSVGWLRQAWTLEEQSSEVLPSLAVARAAAQLKLRRRSTKLPSTVAMFTAAAAVALALAYLNRTPPSKPSVVVNTPIAVRAIENSTEPALEPAAAAVAVTPITEFPPAQFVSRDDGIELLCGSVRLVLLTQDD